MNNQLRFGMLTFLRVLFTMSCGFIFFIRCEAQPVAETESLPLTWVDKDTGHRIWRLTDEEHSVSPYFNTNAFTPDGQYLVYTAPDGIRAVNIYSRHSKLLIANGSAGNDVQLIALGSKTGRVFFLQRVEGARRMSLRTIDISTGEIRSVVDLPPGLHIDSINSDETLAIGTRLDAVPRNQDEKIRHKRYPRLTSSMLSSAKYEAYQRRFEAKIPLIMFTMNLSNGKISEILHSSEWLNHLLFSPTDPRLLIYSHEGPWHLVDRIWEIRTDGSHKTLIHQRTVPMEIAGHEFWSGNGEQIWYDWQYPKGVSFYLASYDVHSGARQAYAIPQDARSIHYNISRDGRLLAGDGRAGRPGRDGISRQWLILLRPHDRELNAPPIAPGYPSAGNLEKESLVNMEAHDYAYEPNVRFSPDGRLVIFRSNMFGPGFVFAVEVEKSKLDTLDVVSTPAIARRYRNRDRTTISP